MAKASSAKKATMPWESNGTVKMLLVHMSEVELQSLDNMQGGPDIDPDTGIRRYVNLAPLIDLPEVRQLFFDLVDQTFGSEKDYKAVKKATQKKPLNLQLPFVKTPAEKTKGVSKIEDLGDAPDKYLAWLPANLVDLFLDLRPDVSVDTFINKKTGLLEFGFFDKLLSGGDPFKGWSEPFKSPKRFFQEAARTTLPVAGFMIGGPMGAGLGNVGGQMIAGQPFSVAARRGLETTGATLGAQTLGSALGMGEAIGGFAPKMAAPAIGNLFGASGVGATGMGAAGLGAGTLGSIGSLFGGTPVAGAAGALPIAGAAGSGAASAAAAPAAASGGFGGLLSSIGSSPLLPLAMGAMMFQGEKKKHEHQKEHYDRQMAERERMREGMGYVPWRELPSKERELDPEYEKAASEGRSSTYSGRIFKPHRATRDFAKGGLVDKTAAPNATAMGYKASGLIKGPGDGQADKIRTTIPQDSYIVDATSTADFGNGSSDAGGKVLKKLGTEVLRKHGGKVERKPYKPVDVYLSDNEFYFTPEEVAALGGGSNQTGAFLLKKMVKNLRKHKNSNHDRLAPKAKDPLRYIGAR